MVLNGMSHKSCNESTTGWRATFRSLDDFPVPVTQCLFKVYLDSLDFSNIPTLVTETNRYLADILAVAYFAMHFDHLQPSSVHQAENELQTVEHVRFHEHAHLTC